MQGIESVGALIRRGRGLLSRELLFIFFANIGDGFFEKLA
jgi:hypothetical protein